MSTVDFDMMIPLHATLAQTAATAPPLAGSGSGPVGEAQQPLGGGAAPTGGGAPPAQNPFSLFLPIILIMGVMFFFTMMSGRKEKKKRMEMLSSIAKYDKVQTVGGLIGSVHEVRADEITLKVDESTNTKVHIARSAVQTVLRKGPLSGGAAASDSSSTDSKNEALEAVAS
ncbi:MAG: preprotein translocase subunit YajC [Phycisphaeraceae bacterium]|nr:preprotein translocase subunit YajC [Phycisphaeraceae bacterium]